jgi:hypothetical protein
MPAPRTDPWITVPQAARLLDVTPPTARLWALEGRYRYRIVAGKLVIERASLVRYQTTRPSATTSAGAAS